MAPTRATTSKVATTTRVRGTGFDLIGPFSTMGETPRSSGAAEPS